jgi:hypothetical protein
VEAGGGEKNESRQTIEGREAAVETNKSSMIIPCKFKVFAVAWENHIMSKLMPINHNTEPGRQPLGAVRVLKAQGSGYTDCGS